MGNRIPHAERFVVMVQLQSGRWALSHASLTAGKWVNSSWLPGHETASAAWRDVDKIKARVAPFERPNIPVALVRYRPKRL